MKLQKGKVEESLSSKVCLNGELNDVSFNCQFLADVELFDSIVSKKMITVWDSIEGDLNNSGIVKDILNMFIKASFDESESKDSDGDAYHDKLIQSQESSYDADGDIIIDTEDALDDNDLMDETIDESVDEELDNTHIQEDEKRQEEYIIDEAEVEMDIKVNRMNHFSCFKTALVSLYAVNTYHQSLQNKLKHDVKAYLSSLSCEIINGLAKPYLGLPNGFEFLFEHRILKTQFFLFLNNSFIYPSKAQIDSLVKFHSTFTHSLKTNVQGYIQVFICKELFKKREYHLIYKEIKDFNIDKPKEIETFQLRKMDMFIHYYILGKSCMVANNYLSAYQLFQTMASIGNGIKIKEDLIIFIMCEYILILMKLGKSWNNKDFIFLRYFNLFPLELVECYRYFCMGDYSKFIKSYLKFSIKTLPIDPHEKVIIQDSNMITKQKTMFTDSLLRQLCVNLLKKRFHVLHKAILDSTTLDNIMCKSEIQDINNILAKMDININLKKILSVDTRDLISTDKALKKSVYLIELNQKLSDLIDELNQQMKNEELVED